MMPIRLIWNGDGTCGGMTLLRYCILPLLLWSVLVGASLWSSLHNLEHSKREVASTQGREVFRLVEAMRVWNAEHGGIYVLQTERDPPNPYLSKEMRASATITGQPLTLLNPAYMTRQISGVIEREAGIKLHLTSLNPINPNNKASDWEADALRAFEQKALQERITIEHLDGKDTARYIAPLFVKQACLKCHEKQGYKLGDVRGGLSVQWSVEPLTTAMDAARTHTISVHTMVWFVVGALLVLAIRQLLCNLSTISESKAELTKANERLEATVEARTQQLNDSMRTLRMVGDMAPGVVYQYRLRPDGTTCIPYASERFFDLFGVHPYDVRDDASHAFAAVHPDDIAGIIASTEISARDMTQWHHEFRLRREEGTIAWVLGDTLPHKEEDGSILWNGYLRDITERKGAEKAMHNLAYYDALTGLPNRRLLSDRLAQAMASSKRNNQYGALMFLDLDNFKPLNDEYGHEVGDVLLIEASNRIKQCLREIDTVARFGGDEFVVMLTELSINKDIAIEQSRLVAEKIKEVISQLYELNVKLKDGTHLTVQHRCTVSVGVVPFINHENNEQELLNYADKAMYQAKREGRNQVRFFEGT